MSEKDDFTGNNGENCDRWTSDEARQRSLANLRPFTSDRRPVNGGRPKGSGLKKELRKALRTRLQSDPLKRPMVRLIAEAMVKAAAKGNVQAAQFIRDELDGRLPKPMEGEAPPSQIIVTLATNVPRFNFDYSKLAPELRPTPPPDKSNS